MQQRHQNIQKSKALLRLDFLPTARSQLKLHLLRFNLRKIKMKEENVCFNRFGQKFKRLAFFARCSILKQSETVRCTALDCHAVQRLIAHVST